METFAHDVAVSTPRSPLRAAGVAVAGIWIASLAIAIGSPDMVTGAAQEHIPIAALTVWFASGLATALVIVAVAVRGRREAIETSVGAIIAIVWIVVAAASIWSPVMQTGADPTTIPLAALVAPMVGSVATAFICILAAGGGADRVG